MPKAAPRRAAEPSPLLRQYRALKERHPGVLLLFRVGDFYELYDADAEVAARALELTLTSRDFGGERASMCGLPVHALDRYLPRLLRAGFRAAVVEQTEEEPMARAAVRINPAVWEQTGTAPAPTEPKAATPTVPAPEQVLATLTAAPQAIDDLVAATRLPVPEVQSALVTLELNGAAERLPGNRFRLKPTAAPEPPPPAEPAETVTLPATALAELMVRLARLESRGPNLPAAPAPEPAVPVAFPGEVGREEVDGITLVFVQAEWRGQPTIGAFRVVNRQLEEHPLYRKTAKSATDSLYLAAVAGVHRLHAEAA